jgi:beta-N-acetylhexosaminidase
MTLDQKLSQLLVARFEGPSLSSSVRSMIHQHEVGAIVIYAISGNIVSASQLQTLLHEARRSSRMPLVVAVDQEGGRVDRLKAIHGPRPPASAIGATGDPERARAAGRQDAADLASFGIHLNLAPVVDVTRVPNWQLDQRTFGADPGIVTRMAAAYLDGLQESGVVLGALKHFPGLGSVADDPHTGLVHIHRPRADLEAIDWAPYRALIQGGAVHAVMVTHAIVHAVDPNRPASLSPAVLTDVLRGELGFRGVVIADALTMGGAAAHAAGWEGAPLAIQAGADWLIGPASPADVAAIVGRLRRAVQEGSLTVERIDSSVRRILELKRRLGLLTRAR